MAYSELSLAQILASRPELLQDDPTLVQRSFEWSVKIRRKLLESHTPARERDPVFFWSYGPQGSGKSTTVSNYFNSLGVDPIELNIDDLTRRYARDVLNDESAIATNEGYFSVRNKWPNFVRHRLLRECSERGLDIVWETTGRGSNLWSDFCSPLVKQFGYKIVVIYVLVPFVQLRQRLEARIRLTKQCHATSDAILSQCRTAARNTRTWFINEPQTTGGFVYFNNTCGFGEQQRISSVELQNFLLNHKFDSEVVSSIHWRSISDLEILSKSSRHSSEGKKRSPSIIVQGPGLLGSRKLNTRLGA